MLDGSLLITGAVQGDDTFAVPGAQGCGPNGDGSLDAVVNAVVGLPSPAGSNHLVLDDAASALGFTASFFTGQAAQELGSSSPPTGTSGSDSRHLTRNRRCAACAQAAHLSLCVEPALRSQVTGNAFLGGLTGDRFSFDANFAGVVERNNFTGNRACGVFNESGAATVALNNYWGAATGPALPRRSRACGGMTTAAPFATKPFNVKAPIKP